MPKESKWAADREIPSVEATDGVISAEHAETLWRRYQVTQPRMIERFRHCMGCTHLRQAGGTYLVCCYLLETGKKRPCPFGTECPVKTVPDGFRFPDGYLDWVRKIDEREETEDADPKTRGRKPLWDVAYAKDLYDRGFCQMDIVRIMDVNKATLMNYSIAHLWSYGADGRKLKKRKPCRDPAILEAERERYRRHVEETGGRFVRKAEE